MEPVRRKISDKVRLSELEADLAYFDARISLVKEDRDSSYRRAQVKAFEALSAAVTDTAAEVRKRYQASRNKKAPSPG